MAEEMEERKGANKHGMGPVLSHLLPPLFLTIVREPRPTEKVAQHWSDSRAWAPGYPAEQD